MRTLDTSAVISKVMDRIKNYPDGSVSKREVVADVPCTGDIDEFGRALNGKLTKAIYAYWEKSDLLKPPHWSVTRDELTAVARQACALE